MSIINNNFSEEVWKTTYKYHLDNSIDDTLRREAKCFASVEEDKTFWEEKFYNALNNFKVVPGGRIIANAGTEWTGTTFFNCFTGFIPENNLDSIEGIYKALYAQAQTLKSEGGWGINFSFIRPRGSFINGIGVESPGAVAFMELFDKSSEIITSGSGLKSKNQKAKGKIRKGAQMSIIDCSHPDVLEFITAKQTPGRLTKFNMSVNFSNKFMNRLIEIKELQQYPEINKEQIEILDKWDLVFPDTTYPDFKELWNGDLEYWQSLNLPIKVYNTISLQGIWNLVMNSTYNRAEPGVLFMDQFNKDHLLNYLDPKYKIFTTNPCFTGDMKILTSEGYKSFEELCDTEPEIINYLGNKSQSKIWCSGEKEIIELKFEGNIILPIKCTPDHVFLVRNINGWTEKFKAKDLRNQRLISPVFYKYEFNEEAFISGFIQGEGNTSRFLSNKHLGLEINIGYKDSDIKKLLKDITSKISIYSRRYKEIALKYNLSSNILPTRELPDLSKLTDEEISNFLCGLYSANGSIISGARVAFKSTCKTLVEQLKEILSSRFNIESYITTNKSKIVSFSNGDYQCKESYDLNIDTYIGVKSFIENIGFYQKYKKTNLEKLYQSKSPLVKSITNLGIEKVYDFTEPITNWGIVNEVVVHNCSEQGMPNASACCIGAVNLTQFVDIQNKVFDYLGIYEHARILARILDNVNTISDAPEWYLDAIRNRRRIGCGIMGWGSALYMLQVRFGSEEASRIQEELMKAFTSGVVDESIELARIKDSFKECDNEKIAEHAFLARIGISEEQKSKIRKYGIRNSSLFSIQPNGNSSVLCNIITGGCEPLFDHEYTRTVIVPECPNNLREFCPKYWEKQFHETSIFKLTKEGDEEILRGEFEGVVYKIDKSRGLTKEVWCEDYSIHKLKEFGLWDSQADWAVTSQDLDVEDHVRDLKGFCKYIDSSASKTISIPNSYPLEDFENVYLDAYKSGIKGITTYRAGTMLSVLSIDTEKKSEEFKRPEILSCDIYRTFNKSENTFWYIFIGLKKGKPYEIFAGSTEQDTIPSKIKDGLIKKIKHGKVKPATYDLICEGLIVEDLVGTFSGELFGIQTRLISALLRNDVDIEQITKQLQKDPTPSLHTFFRVVSRVLKKYITDGTISKQVCSECSGEFIFQEGCFICKNCGYSKCT